MAKEFPLKIRISAIDAFSKPLANVSNKLGRIGGNWRSIGTTMSLGITAPLVGGIGLALRTAGEIEKMQTSLLTVFQGNKAAADAAYQSVVNFAKSTPFEMGEVLDSFIKLKAYGLDPSEQALQSYGNTASAMGKTLNQMIEAVADSTTGEFERLKEFGIRANKQGKQVTFTFRGVKTKVKFEAGEIQKYLRSLGDVDFAGGMERQSKTLFGLLSNLKDTFTQAVGGLGMSFANAINLPDLILRLSDGITKFKIAFDGLSPNTKKFAAWTAIVIAAGGPVLASFGLMALGIGLLLTPVGLLVLAGIALGAAFLYVAVQLGSFKDAAKGALVAVGDWITDLILAPLRLVTYTLELAMRLMKIGGNGGFMGGIRDALNGFNNFSLANNAGVQNWMAPGDAATESPALGPWAQSGISTAAANRVQSSKSEVSIVFKNQPQGMRVSTDSDRNTSLSISQGLSMVTP